jgi:hypothetical protein
VVLVSLSETRPRGLSCARPRDSVIGSDGRSAEESSSRGQSNFDLHWKVMSEHACVAIVCDPTEAPASRLVDTLRDNHSPGSSPETKTFSSASVRSACAQSHRARWSSSPGTSTCTAGLGSTPGRPMTYAGQSLRCCFCTANFDIGGAFLPLG